MRFAALIVSILLLSACVGVSETVPLPEPALPRQDPPSAIAFDIQGHRGARGLKPENTLPAFETALDLGVTTLELDLQRSADGELVIWHEPDIPGAKCTYTADGDAPSPPRISRMTLAQVQAYRCDKNPERGKFPKQDADPTPLAGDNYQIITLAQLLDFVDTYADSPEKTDEQRQSARSVQFNMETKRKSDDPDAIGDNWDGTGPGDFEREIVQMVEDRGLVERVIVQSFVHESLWAVQELNPDIRLAALTSRGRPDPAAYAEKGATIWSPSTSGITPGLLTQAHDAGLLVIPWTPNSTPAMQQLIDLGVDGIITDRPDLLVELVTP